MTTPAKHIRTDIQALRAVAVLAVVIYHLWPDRLTGGFMGVDVFFVISGYLMTATLARNIQPIQRTTNKLAATTKYLAEFYARRIKRLVPAASVTLLAVSCLTWATGNYTIIEDTAKQVIASALFTQNLFLVNQSVDYLAASTPPTAVQHFWSLSLEEQFYLVWPLVLLATILLTTHLSVVYKKHKFHGAIIPTTILTIVSFAYGYHLTQTDPSSAYFMTFARVWELLVGGLLVFVPKLRNYDLSLLLPWLGAAMIGYSMYAWGGAKFPGWHALIPTLGTALIIHAGTTKLDSRYSFAHALKNRVIQWIGNISYSLYLWHWPLIVLAPVLLSFDINGHYSFVFKLSILFASVIIAWLSYRYIELPALRAQLTKRWVYVCFITTVLLIASIGYVLAKSTQTHVTTVLRDMHAAVRSSTPCTGAPAIANCFSPFSTFNTERAKVASRDKYTTLLSDGRSCDMYHAPPRKGAPVNSICYIGDTTSSHTITLWGDSHATHLANSFDVIGKRTGTRVALIASGECSGVQMDSPACQDRFAFVESTGLLTSSSAIIVSNWVRILPAKQLSPTEKTLEFVTDSTSSPVYLLEDTPLPGRQDGASCTNERQLCNNTRSAALTLIKQQTARIVEKGILPVNHIIPTDDLFCDSKKCYGFVGNLPVYQDIYWDDPTASVENGHITGSYAYSLATPIETKLRTLNIIP